MPGADILLVGCAQLGQRQTDFRFAGTVQNDQLACEFHEGCLDTEAARNIFPGSKWFGVLREHGAGEQTVENTVEKKDP